MLGALANPRSPPCFQRARASSSTNALCGTLPPRASDDFSWLGCGVASRVSLAPADLGDRPAHDITERMGVLIVEEVRGKGVVTVSRGRPLQDPSNRIHHLVDRDSLHANVVAITWRGMDMIEARAAVHRLGDYFHSGTLPAVMLRISRTEQTDARNLECPAYMHGAGVVGDQAAGLLQERQQATQGELTREVDQAPVGVTTNLRRQLADERPLRRRADEDDVKVMLIKQPLDQFSKSVHRPAALDQQIGRVGVDHEIPPRLDSQRLKLGGDLVSIPVVDSDRTESVGVNRAAAHRSTELQVDVANGVPGVEVHQVRVAAPLVLGGFTIEPDPIPR